MSKTARSARGDVVDFDLLAIKQQLALKPVPVGVDARRKFIDKLDGIKSRKVEIPVESALPSVDMDGPLAMAAQAAQVSANASE